VEILREAGLKKAKFVSADFPPILWTKERFCRPLKNRSVQVNYIVHRGWRLANFLLGVFQKIKMQDQRKHTCSSSKISMMAETRL
jgi:hypothetical protein